jgi:nucleoside-diphosphate-sugar epimerase
MLALLGSSYTGPVNIGSDEERSVLEVAQLVLELAGSRSGIVFRDRPVDDPSQRRPDLTLARRELGWEPATSMPQGLAPTIAWFRTRIRG